MIGFIKRLLHKNTQPRSGTTAKERLQVVLIHDRANLSSGFVSIVKEDVLRVVSQYAEIDEKAVEVSLEERGRTVALTANIPIMRMKRDVGELQAALEKKQKS